MALTVPAGQNAQLVCIPLHCKDVATSTTSAAALKPGFAGRIVGINAAQMGVAGTQPTVDVEVRKDATAVVSAAARVVAGSATIVGGTVATLSTTSADLDFTATNILCADITVTGTSTVVDTVAYVWVVRK